MIFLYQIITLINENQNILKKLNPVFIGKKRKKVNKKRF